MRSKAKSRYGDQVELPYGWSVNPSSGFAAGSETSEAARRGDDKSGRTKVRQNAVMRIVADSREYGITDVDLRKLGVGHHGQTSSALSNLHKAGHLARLRERRDKCQIYVLPLHVNGRETVPFGRKKKAKTDRETEEIRNAALEEAAVKMERMNSSFHASVIRSIKREIK